MAKKNLPASDTAAPLRLVVKEDKLTITYRANPELLRDLAASWRDRPNRVVIGFERFVRVQGGAAVRARRPRRRATLNALVPTALRERFDRACKKAHFSQDHAIKLVLRRYIDGKEETRIVARSPDRKMLWDPYGNKLMKVPERTAVHRPEFKAEPRAKLQFDADTAGLKAVIEDLIEEIGVGKSRFFAFVLSEAIEELEKRAPELPVDLQPDVTPETSPSLPAQAT